MRQFFFFLYRFYRYIIVIIDAVYILPPKAILPILLFLFSTSNYRDALTNFSLLIKLILCQKNSSLGVLWTQPSFPTLKLN